MFFDKKKKQFVEKLDKSPEDDTDQNEYDLIGSLEYMAPEVISANEYTKAVDYWALGCIIYLFFHGKTPFQDQEVENIFLKIKKGDYNIREDLDSDSRDIIIHLLELNPKKRLGTQAREAIQARKSNKSSIKDHPFFKNIDFKNLYYSKVPINLNESISENNSETLIKFNSCNNGSSSNFIKFSPLTGKLYKNKSSHDNIFGENVTDSFSSLDLQEDRASGRNNSKLNYDLLNAASPFKLNESFFSTNSDKISLENEIYNSNNSLSNFLSEERRKSKIISERFFHEKPKEQQEDERLLIMEGMQFFRIKKINLIF